MFPNYNNYSMNGYGMNTNPMQPQMDRLNMLQQQYNQQPQQQQQPQQMIIPVASAEEVRSHPIDWSGNTTYFIDNANRRIYTKQLNLNGIPEVNTYILNNEVIQKENARNTSEEFINRLNVLEQKMNNFENIFLGGNVNGKSDSNDNANGTKREYKPE